MTNDLDLLYADLVEAASDPARAPRSPKTIRAGAAAAAGGRAFLLAAYGSGEALERAMLPSGRVKGFPGLLTGRPIQHRTDADDRNQS